MMFSYAGVTTLYVSEKTGSDFNLGVHYENTHYQNGPVKTIAAALKAVSEMRRSGYLQPVKIALMDEEYDFSEVLQITYPKGDYFDKPPVVSDVTISPFGNGRVLFSGGKRITGFEPDTFNGAACVSVHLPEVKEGKWSFTDLYVDGKPAKKTKRPENGYFYPKAVENVSPGTHTPSRWFIAEEGDIPKDGRSIEDGIISFCHYWVDEHSKIASFDPETGKVYFDGRTRMTISAERNTSATMAYYIENLAEDFKNPGEWYLDKQTGKLYYILQDGETAESITVYAPQVDRLICLSGNFEKEKCLRGIHFENIDFAYTKGEFSIMSTRKDEDGNVVPEKIIADGQCCSLLHGVVNLEACEGCTFVGCRFYAYGSHAVVLKEGCHDCRVSGCEMRYAAGGGVAIEGGDENTSAFYQAHHNVISDCRFSELGLRYFSASGVLITHGYANEISHNEICHLYYSGICVGWRWGYGKTPTHDNLIYKNHIYDLGRGVLSDMGGIYTLGAQPGTRIEGNLIHDVKSRNYGGWGLYSDEGSAYIVMENNICYNCSSNCYHQHYGYMNTIRNNIFAFAGGELVRITRREAQEELLLENNIFLTKNGNPVYGNTTGYDFVSNRNVIFDADGKTPLLIKIGQNELSLEDVREHLGFDAESVIANPLFTDADKYDFSLLPKSPAYQLGFHSIDMSDVGPRMKR